MRTQIGCPGPSAPFNSDYCLSKLNFQPPVRNTLSRMQQSVWSWGKTHSEDPPLLATPTVSLTLHWGNVGRGALLPNHRPCSTAEAKNKLRRRLLSVQDLTSLTVELCSPVGPKSSLVIFSPYIAAVKSSGNVTLFSAWPSERVNLSF